MSRPIDILPPAFERKNMELCGLWLQALPSLLPSLPLPFFSPLPLSPIFLFPSVLATQAIKTLALTADQVYEPLLECVPFQVDVDELFHAFCFNLGDCIYQESNPFYSNI